MLSGQLDLSARQVDHSLAHGVENTDCPSLARRRGAACLAELRRSARLAAQRPVCQLALSVSPAWSMAPAGGLLSIHTKES